jgi:uncharacterized protein YuzE
MKMMYHPEGQTLYLRIGEQNAVRSEEKPGVIVMRDHKGKVCAIAISNPRQLLDEASPLDLTQYLEPAEVLGDHNQATQQLLQRIQVDL